MFAYTYSHVTGVQFDTGGYHQITLGVICSASRSGTNVNVQPLINLNLYFNVNKICQWEKPYNTNDCYVAENATIVGDEFW
jgi:hypothetical protein